MARESSLWPVLLLLLYVGAPFINAQRCRLGEPGEQSRFERVREDAAVGTYAFVFAMENVEEIVMQATDPDKDYTDYFQTAPITENTGGVLISKPLKTLLEMDRPTSVVKFRLICRPPAPAVVPDILVVTLYVQDVNDHEPKFIGQPYMTSVNELTPTGMIVFDGIKAVDLDKADTANSDVHYWISSGNDDQRFSLVPQGSGGAAIALDKPLDFEAGDRQINLTITAADRGNPKRLNRALLTINVQDGDDHPPKFTSPIYHVNVTEYPGTEARFVELLLRVRPPILAYDADLAVDQRLHYRIVSGESADHFRMHPDSGEFTLTETFDREQLLSDTFSLFIEAYQTDDNTKSAQSEVRVRVTDLNDNRPDFRVDMYDISIMENLLPGFSIVRVQASDRDEGENAEFSYRLEDDTGAFTLDPQSGWLTVKDQTILDRETQDKFSLKIYAEEVMPNVLRNQTKSFAKVNVHLLDSNDNNPKFHPSNTFQFTINGSSPIGTVVGKVQAKDSDSGVNAQILYSLVKGPETKETSAFAIDQLSGQISQRDVVAAGTYVLFVRARDSPTSPSAARSSLAVVTVHVISANKHFPRITPGQRVWVGKEVEPGSRIGHVTAEDEDQDLLTYRLKNPSVPFEIESETGFLRTTAALTARSKYRLEVEVTDGENVVSASVDVIIVSKTAEQTFESGTVEIDVDENVSNRTIGNLLAGYKVDGAVSSNIINPSMNKTFRIESNSDLVLLVPLDFEELNHLSFTAVLKYASEDRNIVRAVGVTVKIRNLNDNPPRFSSRLYRSEIVDPAIRGTELVFQPAMRLTDADGLLTELNFSLHGCGGYLSVSQSAVVMIAVEEFNIPQLECVLRVEDEAGLESETMLIISRSTPTYPYEGAIRPIPSNKLTSGKPEALTRVGSGNRVPVQTTTQSRQEVVAADQDLNQLDQRARSFFKSDTVSSQWLVVSESLNLTDDTQHRTIQVPVLLPLLSVLFRLPDELFQRAEDIQNTVVLTEMLLEKQILRKPSRSDRRFMVDVGRRAIVAARVLSEPETVVVQIAFNSGEGSRSLVVIIEVVPIKPARFLLHETSIEMNEGSYIRTSVGKMRLTGEVNVGDVVFSVVNGSTGVDVDQNGTMFITSNLDYEQRSIVLTTVRACSRRCLQLALQLPLDISPETVCLASCDTARFIIRLLDVNDNRPIFLQVSDMIQRAAGHPQEPLAPYPVYKLGVPTLTPADTVLMRVEAHDVDSMGSVNSRVRFRLATQDEQLRVDADTGVLRTSQNLSLESGAVHRLMVTSYDLGTPQLTTTALIELTAVENHSQIGRLWMFDRRVYRLNVPENSNHFDIPMKWQLHATTLGKQYTWDVQQLQSDVYQPEVTASIVNNSLLHLKQAVDFENTTELMFLVTAEERSERYKRSLNLKNLIGKNPILNTTGRIPINSEQLELKDMLRFNQAIIRVYITDVNDNYPQFKLDESPAVFGVPYDAGYGFKVANLKAVDEDANDTIRYSLYAEDFKMKSMYNIDSVSGQVWLLKEAASVPYRMHHLHVNATDAAGHTTTAYLLVYVLDSRDMTIVKLNQTVDDVRHNLTHTSRLLSKAAGSDVRIVRVRPHTDGDIINKEFADVWIYSLDSASSTLIDGEEITRRLLKASQKRTDNLAVSVAGAWPIQEPSTGGFSNLKFVILVLALVILCLVGAVLSIVCFKSCQKGSMYPALSQITSSMSGFSSSTSPPIESEVHSTSALTSTRAAHLREMAEHRSRYAENIGILISHPTHQRVSRKLSTARVGPGHYVARDGGDTLELPRAGSPRPRHQSQPEEHYSNHLFTVLDERNNSFNTAQEDSDPGVATMTFYSESPTENQPQPVTKPETGRVAKPPVAPKPPVPPPMPQAPENPSQPKPPRIVDSLPPRATPPAGQQPRTAAQEQFLESLDPNRSLRSYTTYRR